MNAVQVIQTLQQWPTQNSNYSTIISMYAHAHAQTHACSHSQMQPAESSCTGSGVTKLMSS